MTAPKAIEVHGLTKRYGSFQALHALDFEVASGEAFGFIGPNGAGKTTLIRTMLDLLHPTTGSITILGFDSHRQARRVHELVGYVPGDLDLWERLTARQTLAFFAGLRGGRGTSRIEPLAERLKLDLEREVRDLSKGNREKVGLIQAFMHDPELMVLDEPTSGLDPLVQHEVFEMIDEAKKRGRTIFFSSHYLNEVERIADRVALIREGEIIALDTIAHLKERARRRIEIRFSRPVDAAALSGVSGVEDVRISDAHASLAISGSMGELIRALAELPVEIVSTPDPDLEEVFLGLYGAHHERSEAGNEGQDRDAH
jgi:ABC-2 type transport system ATP-binding protein